MRYFKISANIPLILVIIAICITLSFEIYQKLNSSDTSILLETCTIFTACAGIYSIYIIYTELKVSADMANAEFLLNLMNEFFQNEDIRNLYIKLDKSNSDAKENDGIRSKKYFDDENDQVAMIHFLAYFKLISNLIERNVSIVKLSEINALLADIFFLAVQDPEFQDKELMKNRQRYKDIFRLYNQWDKYRREEIQNIKAKAKTSTEVAINFGYYFYRKNRH